MKSVVKGGAADVVSIVFKDIISSMSCIYQMTECIPLVLVVRRHCFLLVK